MADLAELVVRIKADTAQLERGMRQAQGIVKKSTSDMGSAASALKAQFMALAPAISLVAFAGFVKSAISAADRLNDLSQRTGVLGSTLSALNIPLLQSGSSVDEFAASINRMNNMVGEAAKGLNQEAIKAFDDLGLSVRKLQMLTPEEQFFEIADALSRMGSQSEMTNAGMAIFGRSFSSLIPLIKDAGGNMKELTDRIKENGDALSDEELARIDAFGDKMTSVWEHAKLALVDYLNFFAQAGEAHRRFFEDFNLPAGASYTKPKTLSDEEAAKSVRKSMGMPEHGARGSNAGLLKPSAEAKAAADAIKTAQKSLADYNIELSRQSEYAKLAPAEQKARKAYYDTLDLAQKAGVKNAEGLAEANAAVARSNDLMNQKMQESARFSAELKDQFAQTAGDIIFGAKSAKDALKGLSEALAKMILQRGVLGPLSDSLFGAPGSGSSGALGGIFDSLGSSIGSMLPSFDVGSDYVPRDMIAKIHKGERIVPANQNRAGSGGVTVKQYFTINAGVAAEVRQQVAAAAPAIASAARNAVFSDIQKGGSASKIVGVR